MPLVCMKSINRRQAKPFQRAKKVGFQGFVLDVMTYNPVARMGYMDYSTVDNKWPMKRPEV